MKQGFVKAASATPAIRVADPVYNAQVICEQMEEAVSHGATIVVFPELCITGYTCGDLFYQQVLLREAKKGTACDCKIYAAQGLSGFCGTSAGI